MILCLSRAAIAVATVVSCAVLSATSASAVTTVVIFSQDQDHVVSGQPVLSNPNVYGPGAIFDSAKSGSSSGLYRSPYDLGPQNGPTNYQPAGSESFLYNSVRDGFVDYYYQAAAQFLDILWGSADPYNTLSFLDKGGAVIASITGSALGNPQTISNHLLTLTLQGDVTEFWGVRLFSDTPAFEHAGLSVNSGGPAIGQTPLPPALILFGSALVGLTLLGRRRRAKGAAIA